MKNAYRVNLNFLIAPILLVVLFASGCGDNKKGSDNQIAATPKPTSDCILSYSVDGRATCNYDYQAHAGFSNYRHYNTINGSFNGSFCGCAHGTMPVYHNNWGLGCVQETYYSYSTMLYFWDTQRYGWVNNPQSHITSTPYIAGNSCVNHAAYACNPSVYGSCGSNGQCLPVGGGIGICQYLNGYNPYYRNPYDPYSRHPVRVRFSEEQ